MVSKSEHAPVTVKIDGTKDSSSRQDLPSRTRTDGRHLFLLKRVKCHDNSNRKIVSSSSSNDKSLCDTGGRGEGLGLKLRSVGYNPIIGGIYTQRPSARIHCANNLMIRPVLRKYAIAEFDVSGSWSCLPQDLDDAIAPETRALIVDELKVGV